VNKSTCEPIEEIVERLIDCYGTDVYKIAFLYMKDQQLAEDVFQEVFYKVMQSYRKFKHDSSEKTWLIRITINTCKDFLKQNWFRRVTTFGTTEEYVDGLDKSRNINKSEFDEELYELILKLPLKYKSVILLFYYEDLTLEEVASTLKLPSGTVQSRLFRGRQRLKKMIEEKGDLYGS